MEYRHSPDAAESILSAEVSSRQLRRALLSELSKVLRPYHRHVQALLFEDPPSPDVVVVLGYDPVGVPVVPGSRMSVLETVILDAPPPWWPQVSELWHRLGSPARVQLLP